MASLFAHLIIGKAISATNFSKKYYLKVSFLAMISAVIPDIDVIGYFYHIPYQSPLGHRGFTHSILFALIWAIFIKICFFKNENWKKFQTYYIIIILFLSTLSHGLVDAMTNGGLGVGFFIPFDHSRYFLPWRPILVSPLGIKNFFTPYGLEVIGNEFIWLIIPSLFMIGIIGIIKILKKTKRPF